MPRSKLSDEERKTRRKATYKKYYDSDKGKALRKKNRERGQKKLYSKKYNSSEKGKTNSKKYRESEHGKAVRKKSNTKYISSEKGQATREKYNLSEKGKAVRKKSQMNYNSSEKGNLSYRLKVLQHYSKTLSNSDVPCCNCCGQKNHIDFLALDHIAGKRQMDSETELTKIGYSSKMIGRELNTWIIKNNFPKGFQVLCSNCNFAKGLKKNNNKCPMKNKPH
jgi:hypothetical protein